MHLSYPSTIALWVLSVASDSLDYPHLPTFIYPNSSQSPIPTFALGDSVNVTWSKPVEAEPGAQGIHLCYTEGYRIVTHLTDDAFDLDNHENFIWQIPTHLSTGQYQLCFSDYYDYFNLHLNTNNQVLLNLAQPGDCPVLWDAGAHRGCIGPNRTTTQTASKTMTTSHATANTTTASSATSIATGTPTVTPPPKSTKERDAGIGIGVPVVAICSALLAWLLHKRHKKRDSRSIGDGISAEDGWDQGIEVAAEQGIDAEEQGKNKALPTTFAELEGKSYLEDTKSPVEMQ